MAQPLRWSTLATGALQKHLDALAESGRTAAPGAVFVLGSHELLDAPFDGERPWALRVRCELPRRELPARAAYVGTGEPSEDAEYARFVHAAQSIGIQAVCRLRCGVADAGGAAARALAGLEQSDLIFFGDTGPPEATWATIAAAAADVPERVRWRHRQGAVL
eukprot:1393667-Prymnesium_polylepis.1